MNVYVSTRNPVKLRAARDAFQAWFSDPKVEVRAVEPDRSLPKQPVGAEVAGGAIARAMAGLVPDDADWGVGIEAGLMRLPGSDRWLSVQVCAVVDRAGRVSVGAGPGYELPEELRDAVLAGVPLRDALQREPSIEGGRPRGAIHHLSGGRIDRSELTVQAVRMALVSARQRRGDGAGAPVDGMDRTG